MKNHLRLYWMVWLVVVLWCGAWHQGRAEQAVAGAIARCTVTSVTNPTAGHRIVITCPAGTASGFKAGQLVDLEVASVAPAPPVTPPSPPPPPPPLPPPPVVAPAITTFGCSATTLPAGASATCSWTVTGTSPTVTFTPGGASTSPVTVTPTATTVYTLAASNSAGKVAQSWTITVTPAAPPPPPPPPPPPTPTPGAIYGTVVASSLGECSAAVHDRYVAPGPDGVLYRTWHPQLDPSGCWFAHEHGDDPATFADPESKLGPPLFGYIVNHTPGHPEEPHEGFKVFVANTGEVNDEHIVNRVYSRSTFHMGSLGPARFTQQHHSAEIYVRHPEFGLLAHTQLMMDTGTFAGVCDPRLEVSKDGLVLGTCRINSSYEIWKTQQAVRNALGQEVYRAFATPAIFDPITAFDPANPTAVIYAWDALVATIKNFPSDDWSGFRGCSRESYAQPGYWYNAGAPTTYWTNSLGFAVSAADKDALMQRISASNSIGAPATSNGQVQYKSRKNYCTGEIQIGRVPVEQWAPIPGLTGRVNKSKLGLRN